MFLELLKKYKEQYDIKIFAYALMPDHLHLLVEMVSPKTGSQPARSQDISDFMHNLNNAYTKYFNNAYDRKGHLFRERFKAALVEKDNYLLKMTVYLHLNPQKLNLASDARTYPYSTYASYLNKEFSAHGIDLKEEITEILGFLGGKSYADFVAEMTPEDAEFLHRKLQRGGIIGSDDFVSRVRSGIESYKSQSAEPQEEPGNGNRYRLFVTAGGVLLITLIGAGAVYFYFTHKPGPQAGLPGKQTGIATSTSVVPSAVMAQPVKQSEDFDNLEWQITLTPEAGGFETGDKLTFTEGKFVSAKLFALGYSRSNYSFSQEANGKIVWETIQRTETGRASWHGEIEGGKMTGILSLRQVGKEPQDFSFTGISSRRRK